MALLNNFSVLPWYKKVEGQDFRRWWKYGRVYPLYSSTTGAVPSQFFRATERTGHNIEAFANWGTLEVNMYIGDSEIGVISGPAVTRLALYPVADHETIEPLDWAMITIAERYQGHHAWAVLDSGWNVIEYGDGPATLDLGDYPTVAYIAVQVEDMRRTHRVWRATNSDTEVITPRTTVLRTIEGEWVADLLSVDLWKGYRRSESGDYLVLEDMNSSGYIGDAPIGQYYLEASDGVDTWVSDVITIVEDTTELIEVQWWDDADFVMDAGRIIYEDFRNAVMLRADIAKPEYEFEEEGDTRDGYFYPTKQISKKKYNFHFLAPEYLLDVMRLIRMADHIQIIYRIGGEEVVLYPMAFLITPEWEREGDLAGVTVEFETDTVAKKVGFSYIREA